VDTQGQLLIDIVPDVHQERHVQRQPLHPWAQGQRGGMERHEVSTACETAPELSWAQPTSGARPQALSPRALSTPVSNGTSVGQMCKQKSRRRGMSHLLRGPSSSAGLTWQVVQSDHLTDVLIGRNHL
jgi:hypothetical protein